MGRLRRSYVFAVSALAAFVVTLAVQRDMGSDYQATAGLLTERSRTETVETSAKDVREMERLLVANETIRQAAREAGLPVQDDSHQFEPAAPTVADIRRQLVVQRSSASHDQIELSVTYSGAEERSAVRMVNAVAQQAVRSHQLASSRRSEAQKAADAAEKAARVAAQDWAETRRKRDTFVAVNEKLLTATPEPSPPLVQKTAPSETPPAVSDATRQRIADLTSRLQAQEVVRKQLLATMTTEHPHYQLVRDQIAQLQAEIAEANRSLVPAEPAKAAVAVQPSASPAPTQPLPTQQALLAELGRLEQNVVAARQQHESLVRAATEARRLAELQSTPEAWVVTPSEDARRLSRPTSVPGVLLALAIGILAGSATLLMGGAIRTLSQAADVEALGLSVLGTVPERGEPVAGASRMCHRPSRWVLWASEATLALFLGAMVIVALKNHEFAMQIAADPLSGLAEGLRRLPSVFGGPVI